MTGGKTYLIQHQILQSFMRDVFIKMGVPREEAEISSEILITSDLRGIESHGIGRLKYYYDRLKSGQHSPTTEYEIVRETSTTAVVDGHHGMGMVIGHRSMKLAIEKAFKYGMGSIAVRNSTHFGIDGYYPLMAIRAGMIGISFTNARPSISPTFGVQAMLGTNPIAVGAPTDEECPFLFDAATSIVQRGKIEVLDRQEKPARENWVIDHQGNSLTNPADILTKLTSDQAALLPLGGSGENFGGHKGYGLATMVEILCASLVNGAFLQGLSGVGPNGEKRRFRVGHFFMAINIENFTTLDEFKKTTGEIMRALRNSRKAPGAERIYTSGEKEYENEKLVRECGVPVIPNLQKEISIIREELRMYEYQFPFIN